MILLMFSNGLLCCAQTQSVSELKDFVKKLNSLPEMTVSIFLLLIFHFRDQYVCFQLILIFWNLLLQRHINLAQHLSTFTSKPAFLGQLDMEHTIVEAQSYDMWAQFLLLSPTFEDLMCWLYVFRFIIYVNILNAKACWLSSKWFTEFQD